MSRDRYREAPSRCGADSTSIHSIELGAGWWSRVSADAPEIQIAGAHATHLGRYRMLARLSRARREIRRVRPRGAPTAAAERLLYPYNNTLALPIIKG